MSVNFLHGVEVIEVSNGPATITVVKSAVVGLVGTAPSWAVQSPAPAPNTPSLVSSSRDAANFGPLIQGYSIPYALAAVQKQGAGQVVVINVFNPTIHFTAIVNQTTAFPATGNQVINLGHMGVSAVVLKNSGGTITYVLGTDYTLDAVNGLITTKSGGAITAGEAVEVSFDYADPTKVQDSDIIGAVTGGVYTGIQALQTTYGTMGFFAKILIAPGFSQDPTTQAALLTMAQTIRAMALIDAPPATPVATAISNRGTAGQAFDTSSTRAILCFPQEQFTDTGLVPTGVTIGSGGQALTESANATADSPFSQWVAGAMAAKDLAKGYWWSPSNTEITGILGPDVSVYASPVDPLSDTNNLNAAGIVTVFNAFGTGLRVWGNRSAGYPTVTTPDNFISVRRTMDVIEESAQLAMLQYVDQPITNGLIDNIAASVNAFLRMLIQQGGLIDGTCTYNPGDNPASQIANGQLVFEIAIMPPPPAERLTFNVSLNQGFLNELGTNVNNANSQSSNQ
ncbi:MAG: phage tail sheath family protein [Candidatus Binataceae bacterium]